MVVLSLQLLFDLRSDSILRSIFTSFGICQYGFSVMPRLVTLQPTILTRRASLYMPFVDCFVFAFSFNESIRAVLAYMVVYHWTLGALKT